MTRARRWSLWPKRTAYELNGISGLAGLGGAAFGVGTWAAVSGPVGLVLSGAGLLITAGTLGYAIFRAVPPKLRRADTLVGQTVDLQDLASVRELLPRLSIVGPSMAGKTTLKDRLTFSGPTTTRTQKMTAFVAATQSAPPRFIAILDGGGEKYPQQFRLAEHCDCLCLVVDHNASDVDSTVDPARLAQHEEFLRQIRHYLDENSCAPKRWIRVLVNKRDLWSTATAAEAAMLATFYTKELSHWKHGPRSGDVELILHSNSDPIDIAKFAELMKNTAVSLGAKNA